MTKDSCSENKGRRVSFPGQEREAPVDDKMPAGHDWI